MSTEAQPQTPPQQQDPAPPVTPPPVTPPDPKAQQTPEQQEADKIRKATAFLAGKIIGDPEPPKQPEKPKETEKKEDKPTETPEPPKEPEAKTKPRKPKQAQEPSGMTAEQIAQLAAATAAEVTKRKEEPKDQEPDESNLELAEEFAPDRQYYEWMQRENPKKYGNLLKQLAEWGPKELEYSTQWERDNPGRKFDPESDEHDEFYEANQPKIDGRDLQAAKAKVAEVKEQLREEEIKRKILDEMAPELSEIRMQKVARAAAPKLEAAAVGAIENILAGINEEYPKYAKDKAKLTEIEESDPIAADVGREMAAKYVPLATEVVAFHNGVPFNKSNPAHVDMYYRTLKLEGLVGNLPPEQQVFEGRSFTTQEKYGRMTPEQRARHWIIGEQELLYDIEREAKAETSSIYQRKSQEFERYAKRKGVKPATNGEHSPAPPPPAPSRQSSAPSVIPGPSVSSTPSSTPITQKSGLDRFHERLLGAI